MNHITYIFLFLIISCSKPIIIAHRGASGYLPEHTLVSTTLAHELGSNYIEADIVVTKDKKLIVFHDLVLDDMTNVRQLFPNRKRSDGHYYVLDFTFKELKMLSVYERKYNGNIKFKDRFLFKKAEFKIPSFDEWIELIQGLNKVRAKNIGIYVELKSPKFHEKNGIKIGELVLNKLREFGYYSKDHNVFIQCFDPYYLKNLKTDIKKIQLLASNEWKINDIDYNPLFTKLGIKKIAQYAYGIGPHYSHLVSSNLIDIAHEYNLKVHVYTLRKDAFPSDYKNYYEFKKQLLNLGIDGYFTDHPDV